MYRQFLLLITLMLWSATTLALPTKASAETVLTRALIQNLRNLVRLMPQNRTVRPARVADAMTPGDALSTGRSSLAELRFNDGSLARIGEQAIFQFITKTRNFKLSNGTILLLIPPGQGTTGVWTPNAAAAIRGSALFIRYIPETKTTVLGALTNSNIEIFNEQGSQRQVLQAGQLAVVVQDRIAGLYNFDLKTFYETSELVQGLNLNQKNGTISSDAAIALVQAETTAALAAQSPITGAGVIVNPAFVRRPTTQLPEPSQSQAQPISELQNNSQSPFSSNSSPITQFLENAEVISNQNQPLSPTNPEPTVISPSINSPNVPGVSVGGSPTVPGANIGVDGNVNGSPSLPGASVGGSPTVPGANVGVDGNVNGSPSLPGASVGSSPNTDQQPNRGNGLGGGVGGGGVNNTGNGNGNGNGNGGANNTGDNGR